jgi:hypothetical protein
VTRHRRRPADVLLAGAVAGALVGAVVLLGLAWRGSAGTVLLDMDGRRIALDVDPGPASTGVRATGGRFQAPAHDLDVPLLEMAAAGDVLNPPTLTDAFLLRDPDRTSGPGTRPRVVVVHAVRGGRAPGNALLSPDGTAPAVRPGDDLWVDGVRYTVAVAEVLPQRHAARSPAIWAHHDDGVDRLVVLTCLTGSTGDGPASHNLVVHARR